MPHNPSGSTGTTLPALLLAEGPLDVCVCGAQSIRQSDRAPVGLEPQPAQHDQGNWLGQLTQTVVVLVYLLPLPAPPPQTASPY